MSTPPAMPEPTIGEVYRAIVDLKQSMSAYVLQAVYEADRGRLEQQIGALHADLQGEREARQEDKRASGVWVRWGLGLVGVSGLANVVSIIANTQGG